MKHTLFCLLALVQCLLLAACGGKNDHDVVETLYPPETGSQGETAHTSESAPLFYLEVEAPTEGEEHLSFRVVNNSGRDAQILMIPTLEKQTEENGWESVPFDGKIGFCGTPDPLPSEGKEGSESITLVWGNLYAGTYRLSYTVTDKAGEEHTASGKFSLTYDLCQYPRAENME